MFPSFAPIIPSAGLFAVLCWPFLVGWLLWISRRSGNVHILALSGAVLTLGALLLFPSRLDILGKISVALASLLPSLLFCSCRWSVSQDPAERSRNEILPFLITGCVLMALSLASALLSCLFIGAGCVVLAWWDGLSPRRAMAAWSMVRLRLCGVILAVLGAALLQVTGSSAVQMTEILWGLIFLVVGLGMMAGLGGRGGQKPSFALLDTGLRFAALCLMARLDYYPLAREIMLGAGLVGLVFSGFVRRYDEAFLPFLVALSMIAASTQSVSALLLLMLAGIVGTCFRQDGEVIRPDWSVAPPVFAALLLVGHALPPVYGVCMILLAGLNCRFLGFDRSAFSFTDRPVSPAAYGVPAVMTVLSLASLYFMEKIFPTGWHP